VLQMPNELKLVSKQMPIEEGQPWTETRWFTETKDGFDGTAQGYGYKSPQALHKAYAYFKNKNNRKSHKPNVKKLLKDNPEVKDACDAYFDADNLLYVFKEGCDPSMQDLVNRSSGDVKKILEEHKHMWKSIEKYYYYRRSKAPWL
jgi:hypothetical protein